MQTVLDNMRNIDDSKVPKNLRSCSWKLYSILGRDGFRHVQHVQHVRPNRGPTKSGPHKRTGKFFATQQHAGNNLKQHTNSKRKYVTMLLRTIQ